MSLVDVFYPDNQGKRDDCIRLSAKLSTLLESNFKKINELIDCIHTYIPDRKFRKITVDDHRSIRSNCEVIKGKVQDIQKYLDEKADEIKRNVDPSLFDQLMSTDIKFRDRIRIAKNVIKVAEVTTLTIASIVMTVLIIKGAILVGIVASIGVVTTCAFAGIAFGVLMLGLDAIISAFLGYYERERLDEALKDLTSAITKFEPSSDEFNKAIERVIIRIEDNFE